MQTLGRQAESGGSRRKGNGRDADGPWVRGGEAEEWGGGAGVLEGKGERTSVGRKKRADGRGRMSEEEE